MTQPAQNDGAARRLLPAVYLLALSLAVAGCSADSAEPAIEADAVREVGDAWIQAYAAGDFQRIPELYTEDAWIMPRGRPRIVGREALRRSLGGLSRGRDVTISVEERELVVDGDLAWFIGDFRVTYGLEDDAPPETQYGRSLIIYKKGEDGKWRVHRDIDSPAPGPQDRIGAGGHR